MTREDWIRVPVGADPVDAQRWTTRGACRRVLLVVHNVTSATRLLDALPLFRADFRIQLLATCTGSSPFQAGVPELLAEAGLPVLPWEQAVATPVDLAVSASYGGQLDRIQGKLAVISHGAGYNKKLATPDAGRRTPDAGRRTPDAGRRTPDAGRRTPDAGRRTPDASARSSKAGDAPVFGLSAQWLLHDGRPLADATVLSHPEQLARLHAACPEAAPTAVLAGDPCYDRLLAALPHRERFRRALGVTPGQRLVVLNSTWNPESLFGDGDGETPGADSAAAAADTDGGTDVLPSLLPRLVAELPADAYRVVAVLHPNIWHGHGPGQIRAWLDRAQRAGLTLVPPLEGWRQALVAADLVLGDQGSVSFYAAAVGTPVLLGAAPQNGLDPDSPVAEFVRAAPRLRPYAPLAPQLDAAIRDRGPSGDRPDAHCPSGVRPDAKALARRAAERTTSAPGASAALLRRTFYELIGIPEPQEPALLDPLPLPPYTPARRTAPLRVLTRLLGSTPPEVDVARYAEPRREPDGIDAAHTAVPEDTTDPSLLGLADVVLRHADADDPRIGPPAAWTTEILHRHPHCALAAYATGPGSCTVRTRQGALLELTAAPDPSGRADLCDPAAYASALHAWLAGGKSVDELAASGLTVRTGTESHHVRVRVHARAGTAPSPGA